MVCEAKADASAGKQRLSLLHRRSTNQLRSEASSYTLHNRFTVLREGASAGIQPPLPDTAEAKCGRDKTQPEGSSVQAPSRWAAAEAAADFAAAAVQEMQELSVHPGDKCSCCLHLTRDCLPLPFTLLWNTLLMEYALRFLCPVEFYM